MDRSAAIGGDDLRRTRSIEAEFSPALDHRNSRIRVMPSYGSSIALRFVEGESPYCYVRYFRAEDRTPPSSRGRDFPEDALVPYWQREGVGAVANSARQEAPDTDPG